LLRCRRYPDCLKSLGGRDSFEDVQTTHKIAGKDAGGYANYLTSQSDRGDYYVDPEDSEGKGAAGEWHGSPSVLASLGLSADHPVGRDQLLALMNGQAPNDAREIRATGGNGTKVAGIDMTFSPPKDVSALWAASSGEHREQIERAHKDAVASAMGHVERDVEVVRVREAGVLQWQTANSLVAAKFTHNTSRLTANQEKGGVPDPQLHTHVVVLASERKDGKFAAVDSRQVFLSARENGAWYRSVLAQNLQGLGLQIERGTGKDGRYFGIKGVPKELADRWSARTGEIQKAAREFKANYGREPNARELGSLTTGTRGTKSTMAPERVDAAWSAMAAERGLSREHAHGLLSAPEKTVGQERSETQKQGFSRELIQRVTQKSSMVSERELYATAYELSAGECHPSQAQELVQDLARAGELIALQGGKWTTKELREREQKTIATVKERANQNAAPVREQSLREAERDLAREIGGPLSQEQRDALRTITGQGGVSTLIGQAGTGKGVVLAAASNAWQKDGYKVIGTAIAGSIAERLGAEAKTDQSLTSDALLSRIEKGTMSLDQNTVVVMDEAGIADTNRLSQIVERTSQKGSKLVLVGDSAQLSPIGAGGLFDHVTDQAPSAELKEVHRAENQWEREAWAQVREGNATKALAAYQAHERLHTSDTREEAREKMLADWNEQRLETAEGRTVMLTDATNVELDELNRRAQEYRDQQGELGNDRATLPDSPYSLAAGDHVMFTKPHYQPGQERVQNGTVGIVKDIQDQNKLTIDTQGANEREVKVDTKEFNDLRLAYAQHVYKGLGLTANNALALIGGWQTDKEHAYVALTRAREQTNIYVSKDNLGTQGMNPDAIERLAERIEQSKAQEASIAREPLATDRSHDQTAEVKLENNLQPEPETTPDLNPGTIIEDGVGAFSPHGPDPSPQTNENETPEERSNTPETTGRDHQPDRPTNEQEPDERDIDQENGLSLGFGIE
jgi:conjugative relaxase-like TrwC/TraI family protein